MVDAALTATGIAYLSGGSRRPSTIAAGELVLVLDDWSPAFSGYYLYYPGRRQLSPALEVIVDALRSRAAAG